MKNITSAANNLFDGASYQNQQSMSKHQCSGKNCTRIARNLLMISFINMKGYFCDQCTNDLLTKQLAVRIQGAALN